MQFLVAVVFGMVCALAFQRKNTTCELKYWRLVAGGVAAGFPHVESLVGIISSDAYLGIRYGITWSPLLAPLFALSIAYIIGKCAKVKWESIYPLTIGTMMISIVMAAFTGVGIRPLTPFSDYHVAFSILHPFDLSILAISLVTLAASYFLARWKRDLSRFGILVVIVYIGVIISFHNKADDFAQTYAGAFGLEVKDVHLLPQPISPLNWRIVVETKDQKFHDTRINLFRQAEKEVRDTSTRAARINAQYKPLSKAVWRIYRRFGTKDPMFAKRAWISIAQVSDQFVWDARFAVFKTKVMYNSEPCAQFMDVTKLGARSKMRGTYMVCRSNSKGAVLYRSDAEGNFSVFETMY